VKTTEIIYSEHMTYMKDWIH